VAFSASDDLGRTLVRPARKDEKAPRYFPNWLRQRVEAIIWTLKNQPSLERHGGRQLMAELASGHVALPVAIEMTLVARCYEHLADHAPSTSPAERSTLKGSKPAEHSGHATNTPWTPPPAISTGTTRPETACSPLPHTSSA
jgi:hypothetical protein